MGAWGPEIFSNDSALDWIGDFVQANDPEMIAETLEIACDDDDVLAAAEIVAALFGAPQEYLPDQAMDWLEDGGADLDPDVIDLALEAVSQVLAASMDPESEQESVDSWRDIVRDLEARLRIAHERPHKPDYRPAGIHLSFEHLEVIGSAEQSAWDKGLLAVQPRRVIRFPPERSFGTLYVR